jgi:hypothetical protein
MKFFALIGIVLAGMAILSGMKTIFSTYAKGLLTKTETDEKETK